MKHRYRLHFDDGTCYDTSAEYTREQVEMFVRARDAKRWREGRLSTSAANGVPQIMMIEELDNPLPVDHLTGQLVERSAPVRFPEHTDGSAQHDKGSVPDAGCFTLPDDSCVADDCGLHGPRR